MALKVVPTKGNLISTKKQLQLAVLGYDLLDKKRNVLIKEMMSLLDDVKMVRDEITEAYQNAYDALQEANISLEDITPTLNFTIHIVNNSGEKFAYNMNLTVDLNGIYDGYSYKGKTTSGTEYQFFKEINNL